MYRDCIEDQRTLKKVRGLRDDENVNLRWAGLLSGAWPTIDEIVEFGADLASTGASRHGCVPSTSDS